MKSLYYFLATLSVLIFFFLVFAVYSLITTIFYVYSVGGLSPLNYGEVTGHLIIKLFGLGCFLLSIKSVNKLRKDKA